VLGDEVDRDEVAAVVEIVETRGGATTSIDVDIGLEELVAAGLLVAGPRSFRFAQALVKDGIYGTTDEEERRALHRAALDHWSTRPGMDPVVAERLARHAEAVGERAVAAQAFATLGEHAHEEHRALDADQAWTGALRHLEARDAARAKALIGRARARYRFQRVLDAQSDLENAIEIAREVGVQELQAEALLEQATALDLSDEFARSKDATAHAQRLLQTSAPTELRCALTVANGRSLYRENRLSEAVPLFQAVVGSTNKELSTIAGLLLGCCLVDLGDLDGAERVFEEVIVLCEASNDRFHLAGAYINRAWLWTARGTVERVADDLRVVIDLARETGHPWVERAATHNLAENRLWQGELEDAFRLARRALALAQSHAEANTSVDQMLIARIQAAQGRSDDLRNTIAGIVATELLEEDRVMLEVLHAVVNRVDGAAWERALAGVEGLSSTQRIEMARLAATLYPMGDRRAEELASLKRANPIWARRKTEV
jgi:tetratricopeptide (TPR) repeat protein